MAKAITFFLQSFPSPQNTLVLSCNWFFGMNDTKELPHQFQGTEFGCRLEYSYSNQVLDQNRQIFEPDPILND